MNIALLRGPALVLAAGIFTALSFGCVAPDGGYAYSAARWPGYYEPYGIYHDYPYGWGTGYYVAPYRYGEHRFHREGAREIPHTYRSAPASHTMPSIPSHRHSDGVRPR